ncbi:MAG: 4Fe-4S dicluster domain-containing protein [Azovibrio sp.]|nr:4Fe-4S dicluster domain-containing protein [Azovibrio sp.]
MEAIAQKIRETAKRLLSEGKVDVVIGFARGSVPMREYPYFAYTPEEAENLTWSSFCCNNLALYTIRRQGRMAVVAQGCVSRNLVGLINENQLKRENLVVIGVNSPGMVDRRKVQALFPGRTITEVVETGDELIVKGMGFEQKVERKKVLRGNCYTCVERNPVICDELIGEKGPSTHGGDIDAVAAPWDKLAAEARHAKFQEEFKDCIRCYACRDACPLCYCHVCFVDEAQPQWCGKTQDEADVATFHILRAFHCAGRCTDCGACESACPQGIKMRKLTGKIEKDIRELYGYRPGMEIGATPPMSLFKPNDPQDFIK